MRDSTSLFDHQADAADELTREFWGDKATWVSDDRGRRTSGRTMQVRPNDDQRDEYRLDHTPTSMRAVRDGIAAFKPKRRHRDDSTGPVQRTRQHGVVTSTTPAPASDPTPRHPPAVGRDDGPLGGFDRRSRRRSVRLRRPRDDLSDLDQPVPVRRQAAAPVAHVGPPGGRSTDRT
ncbi:MAG: hypothetical protein R2697_10145 [Ilumatobacteraceae bacterium]